MPNIFLSTHTARATIATAYLRSKKFLKANGGYNKVVYMTNILKITAENAISEELRDAITTDNEASTLKEPEKFLVCARDPYK
jgi:acetyl-CoA decarbonylase/synthase complex subunit beta